MSWETALVAELKGTAGVTAQVGTRIYPQAAPQATELAYVTYEVIGKRVLHDHGGAGGLSEGRISFLCHAPTYAAAKGAAGAILAALDRRRGSVQGTAFGAILSEEEADAGFDEATRMHVVVQDFRVFF